MSHKPSKKSKNFTVSSDLKRPKKKSKTEDFVGKFLVGVLTALVTVFIGLAVSNQISWLVVILVSIASLGILAVYQSKS
jgi:4-hydroxybenzoate polyprenyltransferase